MPYSLDNEEEQKKEEPGFLSDVGSIIKNRSQEIVDASKKLTEGFRGGAEAGLRTVGSALGGVTDILGEATSHGYKAIGEPGKDIAKSAISAIPDNIKQLGINALKSGVKQWQDFENKYPEAAKDIRAGANIITGVPAVKGTIATAEGLLKGAAKTSFIAGALNKKLGESMFTSVLPMTEPEAKAMQSYLAKNTVANRIKSAISGESITQPQTAARDALQAGFYGTESQIGVQANRVAEKIRGTMTRILDNTKASVYKSELMSAMHDFINTISDPEIKSKYQAAVKAISDGYKNLEEYIPLNKAQAIKRDINTKLPATVFSKGKTGLDITSEYKSLKKIIAETITKKTYERLGPEVKESYLKWSKALELMDVGIKDSTGKKTLFGANFWGKLLDKTVVPIGTTGGQMLYSLGNMMQFKGRPGLKKFGDYVKDTFGEAQLLLESPKTIIAPETTQSIKQLGQKEIVDYLSTFNPDYKKYQEAFIPESVKQKMILDLSKKETTVAELNKVVEEINKHNALIEKAKKAATLKIPKPGDQKFRLDLRQP